MTDPFLLLMKQSKIGITLPARFVPSKKPTTPVNPFADPNNLVQLRSNLNDSLTPYNPFFVFSNGSSSTTPGTKFISVGGGGASFYIPDGVTIAPTIAEPGTNPDIPPFEDSSNDASVPIVGRNDDSVGPSPTPPSPSPSPA
jgi:hypothetical protein